MVDSSSNAAKNFIWELISYLEKLGYKHISTDQPLKSTHARHPPHLNDQGKQCCVFQQQSRMKNHPAFQETKITLDLLEV